MLINPLLHVETHHCANENTDCGENSRANGGLTGNYNTCSVEVGCRNVSEYSHMSALIYHNVSIDRGDTGIIIIQLNLSSVPARLHSGSGKLIFRRYLTTFLDI